MAAGSRAKAIAIAVIAAVAAAGIGYWGYGAYQQRQLRAEVATILKAAVERTRDALTLQAEGPPADRAASAKKLEGHFAATEKDIARLKGLPARRDRALADDADAYLVSVRETLRLQASMYRYYQRHTESLDALRDHMRVDDRRGAWVSAAVRAKERAERDFRDYRLANASYATLLESFPTTQKKIEPAAGAAALPPPEQVAQAREKAIATAQDAAAEMEKVRKLVGPK